MMICTQIVVITKPVASIDEMVNSGLMIIMRKSRGIAKRLCLEVARKFKDPVKGCGGREAILERAGGSFTFDMYVKSREGEASKHWEKPATTNNQRVHGNETRIV